MAVPQRPWPPGSPRSPVRASPSAPARHSDRSPAQRGRSLRLLADRGWMDFTNGSIAYCLRRKEPNALQKHKELDLPMRTCDELHRLDSLVAQPDTLRALLSDSDAGRKHLAAVHAAIYDCAGTRYACIFRTPDAPSLVQLAGLQAALGYDFQDMRLLVLALVHSSVSEAGRNNLAWLGDTALQLVISQHLALEHPIAPLGQLAVLRDNLVSRSRLRECAVAAGIHECAIIDVAMDRAALSRPGTRSQLLAEMFEAVVGAAWLDGGLPAVHTMFLAAWPPPAAPPEAQPAAACAEQPADAEQPAPADAEPSAPAHAEQPAPADAGQSALADA